MQLNDSQIQESILTVNGGSSSIKFAMFGARCLKRTLVGKIDRIGLEHTTLSYRDLVHHQEGVESFSSSNYPTTVLSFVEWLNHRHERSGITAIGHRVVHGLEHTAPEMVTQTLLDYLKKNLVCAPEHLPGEVALMEEFRRCFPGVSQYALFDASFHSSVPPVAKFLPIPRRLFQHGVQRYGFHGLSYAYLMDELARLGDRSVNIGRILLAHLGNGSSMAAVRDGKCVDTSMGFTPTAGLVMGTRSGDLDPGLAGYLADTENMSIKQFNDMVTKQSGLLGVSETSSDMRELLQAETTDSRAADAVAMYCYQAKKWIGAYAASLGGLDTVVFAGGIGENAPVIRERICHGLQFLGIELDHEANQGNSSIISVADRPVVVRVIRTDEEVMIARTVQRLIART